MSILFMSSRTTRIHKSLDDEACVESKSSEGNGGGGGKGTKKKKKGPSTSVDI